MVALFVKLSMHMTWYASPTVTEAFFLSHSTVPPGNSFTSMKPPWRATVRNACNLSMAPFLYACQRPLVNVHQ
jgi:hypothetical protein